MDLVVITGAGQGIGKAIALDFGMRNMPVLCISKSANARRTKEEILKKGGIAESLIMDISNYEKTKTLISKWVSKKSYKKIGVVLAAGILGPTGFKDFKGWDDCYKINGIGNTALLYALVPRMIENKFGRIVAFAGGGSAYPYPLFPAYSASKTAMVRTVENIHEDLKNKGDFAIVCLAPGATETNMLKKVREAGAEVKTVVDISEPVTFVREFILSKSCGFSGAFIHVRDNWKDYLNNERKLVTGSLWKLRRIE